MCYHAVQRISQQHISLEGNVFLQSVSLQAEGVYKCEVTAGRPTFQTVAQEQFLEVYSKFKTFGVFR